MPFQSKSQKAISYHPYRKAWTANSFRQSTADLADMLQRGVIPGQVQHNPGALLVGGGNLIIAAGSVVGGIGRATREIRKR